MALLPRLDLNHNPSKIQLLDINRSFRAFLSRLRILKNAGDHPPKVLIFVQIYEFVHGQLVQVRQALAYLIERFILPVLLSHVLVDQ